MNEGVIFAVWGVSFFALYTAAWTAIIVGIVHGWRLQRRSRKKNGVDLFPWVGYFSWPTTRLRMVGRWLEILRTPIVDEELDALRRAASQWLKRGAVLAVLASVALVGGVVLVVSILASTPAEAEAGDVNLTEADDGITVDLEVGQTLVVTLEGLGTAGYLWEVTSDNAPVLEQVGERELVPGRSDAVGASARESFRFQAVQRGETELTLADRQPFGERHVTKTFGVTVHVR